MHQYLTTTHNNNKSNGGNERDPFLCTIVQFHEYSEKYWKPHCCFFHCLQKRMVIVWAIRGAYVCPHSKSILASCTQQLLYQQRKKIHCRSNTRMGHWVPWCKMKEGQERHKVGTVLKWYKMKNNIYACCLPNLMLSLFSVNVKLSN